jgi:hypothetical protein
LHPEYLIGLPMLLEVADTAWVGLTEAYIDDWAGLFVHTAGNPNVLTARPARRGPECAPLTVADRSQARAVDDFRAPPSARSISLARVE